MVWTIAMKGLKKEQRSSLIHPLPLSLAFCGGEVPEINGIRSIPLLKQSLQVQHRVRWLCPWIDVQSDAMKEVPVRVADSAHVQEVGRGDRVKRRIWTAGIACEHLPTLANLAVDEGDAGQGFVTATRATGG